MPDLPRDVFTDAVPFDAQPAANAYWRGRRDKYAIAHMGPVSLPHPRVWMEWVVPGGALIEGVRSDHLAGLPCGVLMSTDYLMAPANDANPRHWHGFDCGLFTLDRLGQVLLNPAVSRVFTYPDGRTPDRFWVRPVEYHRRSTRCNASYV